MESNSAFIVIKNSNNQNEKIEILNIIAIEIFSSDSERKDYFEVGNSNITYNKLIMSLFTLFTLLRFKTKERD